LSSWLALASACSKSEPKSAESAPGAAPADAKNDDTLKVGFIYVGPRDDFGYNQGTPKGRSKSQRCRA